MNRLFKAIKYSWLGVFFGGIVTVIQGCSAKEGAMFATLLLLLQFCGTPVAGCINADDVCKLYAVNASDFTSHHDVLFQIDPANGSQISVVRLTLPGQTVEKGNALANHPMTNELFGVLDINNCSRLLVTIDPDTGAATSLGNTGSSLSALTFDKNGTLYAVSGRSTGGNCTQPPKTLFEVDQTNGQLTELCTLPSTSTTDRGEALAYHPATELLYYATGDNPLLNSIDDTSGPTCAITNISLSGGDLFSAGNRIRGMVYNPFTGDFLASTGNRLYSLTQFGVNTLLGPLVGGNENLRQLAFVKQ